MLENLKSGEDSPYSVVGALRLTAILLLLLAIGAPGALADDTPDESGQSNPAPQNSEPSDDGDALPVWLSNSGYEPPALCAHSSFTPTGLWTGTLTCIPLVVPNPDCITRSC